MMVFPLKGGLITVNNEDYPSDNRGLTSLRRILFGEIVAS